MYCNFLTPDELQLNQSAPFQHGLVVFHMINVQYLWKLTAMLSMVTVQLYQ